MALKFETEKDFEDFIFDNESWFCEIMGLKNYALYRQVNLGPYGVADIVAVNESIYQHKTEKSHASLSICVIELKNTPVSHVHLSQTARYMTFFDRFSKYSGPVDVRGVVIGAKTFPNQSDLCYLAQTMDRIDVYETTIDPRTGIEFKLVEGWHQKDNQLSAEFSFLQSVCEAEFVEPLSTELKVV